MKNFIHIISAFLITLTAVIPSGLVLCEKDGEVSIEFENGKACSCNEQGIDMAEKFCCDDKQCHEDEQVTETCHEENHLLSNDCSDTKIEAFDSLKYFSNSVKAPVKIFKPSDFFEYSDLLCKSSFDFKSLSDHSENIKEHRIPNQPLTLKKTSVFII